MRRYMFLLMGKTEPINAKYLKHYVQFEIRFRILLISILNYKRTNKSNLKCLSDCMYSK